jgi:hypothetical protein
MSDDVKLAESKRALNLALALAYVKFLKGVDWSDELVVAGAREGTRKFLSNAHFSLFPRKHWATHYVSPAALARLEAAPARNTGLVWEHVVPNTSTFRSHASGALVRGGSR